MGIYINKGNTAFRRICNSEYVDKSELIAAVNKTLFTSNCFSCVSRSRRFGKSLAAQMLCAYYDQSCDSRSLFADLKIAQHPSFEEHLNKYPVIYVDMQRFVTRYHDETIVQKIEEEIHREVREAFPSVQEEPGDDLIAHLYRIVKAEGRNFIFIIDEWDAICREFSPATTAMDEYVRWLRRMFKDSLAVDVFAGVYMTGILPIKKFKTQSALNNFAEYSMIEPGNWGRFFGFTKDEVMALAEEHRLEYDELEKWYDGYQIGDEQSMFNPNSVMEAVNRHRCRSYWASTGAYDAVTHYIQMNFEGLKDDIIRMLAGGRCKVSPFRFQNDMSIVRSKDDVLTVLIHLGYLGYDWRKSECYIPNLEVSGEMENAVCDTGWTQVAQSLQQSEQLLQATLQGDADAVARGIEAVHDDSTSILSYNNENSLACVLSLAYYYARNDYVVHREFATGKGFADLVLIPRKNVDSPAIIIELKYGVSAHAAIDQIRSRQYSQKVSEYTDRLLLVGICYDKTTKQHDCRIERM